MTTNRNPYQIVLADDHVMLREGLKRILNEKPGVEVIGEAGDGVELLDLLRVSKLHPHMVILDFSMPKLSGIEAARQIKTTWPEIKILVLSMHREKEYFSKAISLGAEGYLLKDKAHTDLYSAIDIVRHGGLYFSPLLAGK